MGVYRNTSSKKFGLQAEQVSYITGFGGIKINLFAFISFGYDPKF